MDVFIRYHSFAAIGILIRPHTLSEKSIATFMHSNCTVDNLAIRYCHKTHIGHFKILVAVCITLDTIGLHSEYFIDFGSLNDHELF